MSMIAVVLVCLASAGLGFLGGLTVGRRDRHRVRRRSSRRRISGSRRPIVR